MPKQRCYFCKKKTGLINFTCKCEKIFCSKCKNPEDHNCDFDYKEYQKQLLQKKLVKVINDKIKLI